MLAHRKRHATTPGDPEGSPAGRGSRFPGASAALSDAPHRMRTPSCRENENHDPKGAIKVMQTTSCVYVR